MKNENRSQHKACVIVPAYLEERRIASVVKAIKAHCPHVVVIDDGSADRTATEAESAGAVVLKHETNKGKGTALNTGFKYAHDQGFDLVITMDADGQHSPDEIPKFLDAYTRTGIPVLVGNRMADQAAMPTIRRLTNQFMSWLLSRFMGQYVPDTQCGYRLYRCDVIPFVSAQAEGYAAESEILIHIARRGIRIDSVRVSTIYGDEQSKIHPFRDTLRFFEMMWRLRKRRMNRNRTRI